MAGGVLQHVVEEADSPRNGEKNPPGEVDGCRDLGLLGLARNRGLPLQENPRAHSLRHRNRAFISFSPAVKGRAGATSGCWIHWRECNGCKCNAYTLN